MDEAKLSEGSVSQPPPQGDCHMDGCAAHNKHGSGELTAPRFAVTFTAGLSGGWKCVEASPTFGCATQIVPSVWPLAAGR